MATFTNFATLSYSGGTTNSNTVTGELLQSLTAEKTAVTDRYDARGRVTYVLSLVNSSTVALTGLSVSDDLGGYAFGTGTVYPLAYVDGSLRSYLNGVLQTAPTVAAGPPLTVTGIDLPAGGNLLLIYEADVTDFAPLGAQATVTNTATVTGGGLTAPLTAQATVSMEQRPRLAVGKALSPSAVTENGRLTYTFVIENSGSLAADAADAVVLSDTFDPRLSDITVTYNGAAWTAGTNYTYDDTTGIFTTLAGQITVPAASYAQSSDGTWAVTPGTATLVISGTV